MSTQPPDTPSKAKRTTTDAYRVQALAKARSTVIEDLGEWVAQIPFDTFVEKLLPTIDGFDPSATVEALKMAGALTCKQDSDIWSWSAFKSQPKDSKLRERGAFKPLEEVHGQICQEALFFGKTSLSNASTEFVVCEDATLPSENRDPNASLLADGYGYLKSDSQDFVKSTLAEYASPDGKDDWYNVVHVEEYKKVASYENQDDDVEKVLWGMQHIMRADARRRFTFGITIENTNTRAWFCSRQVVVVSERFNFLEDPLKWVKLVVPLTFGTPVDLGWDPTMQLKHDDRLDKYYYEMTVTPIDNPIMRTYRSVRILSELSADAIRGRATRVFEAYEINQDGQRISENVAIKDYWLDSTREAEPMILKTILEGANESMKAKFLTVLVWGNVTVGGNEDRTDFIMKELAIGPRGYENSEHAPVQFYLCQYKPNRPKMLPSPGRTPSTRSRLTPSVDRFEAKTHKRIVFKEVGHPIHDESSITTVFQAARDAAEALEFMSKKRYVHRDVSSGNILIVDGKGKLADLEYAQIINAGGKHNVRTGTIAFMAIEVSAHLYWFLPPPAKNPSGKGLVKNARPPFVHNPLHDIESLWWILFWVILCKTPSKDTDDDTVREQHNLALRAFPQRLEEGNRSWILRDHEFAQQYEDILLPSMHPYLEHVAMMKLQLVQAYTSAEATIMGAGGKVNEAAWSDTHQLIINQIDELLADPCCEALTLYPLSVSVQNILKRKEQVKLKETKANKRTRLN